MYNTLFQNTKQAWYSGSPAVKTTIDTHFVLVKLNPRSARDSPQWHGSLLRCFRRADQLRITRSLVVSLGYTKGALKTLKSGIRRHKRCRWQSDTMVGVEGARSSTANRGTSLCGDSQRRDAWTSRGRRSWAQVYWMVSETGHVQVRHLSLTRDRESTS